MTPDTDSWAPGTILTDLSGSGTKFGGSEFPQSLNFLLQTQYWVVGCLKQVYCTVKSRVNDKVIKPSLVNDKVSLGRHRERPLPSVSSGATVAWGFESRGHSTWQPVHDQCWQRTGPGRHEEAVSLGYAWPLLWNHRLWQSPLDKDFSSVGSQGPLPGPVPPTAASWPPCTNRIM